MGQVSREEVLALLRQENRTARADDLALYVDCFLDYAEAVRNIAKNGSIVAHPRTGMPMENPYLKVKAQAMAGLLKLRRIKKTERVWALLETAG